MRQTLSAFLACLGMTIISCQQEPHEILDNPQPSVVDSTLLTMYVEIDTSLPPGLDTLSKEVWIYDNNDRVIDYYWIQYNGLYNDTTFSHAYYHSQDTFPYMSIATNRGGLVERLDTAFLLNRSLNYIKDSVISWETSPVNFSGTSVSELQRLPDNNTKVVTRDYSIPGVNAPVMFQNSGTLFMTYANGNIVAEHDTSTVGGIAFDRKHWTAAYDNNPNPFRRIYGDQLFLGGGLSQKNNVVEITSWDIPGQIEDHYKFSYVYRQDGYPVIQRNADATINYPRKWYFYYKH